MAKSFIEAAGPTGEPIYLQTTTDGRTSGNPAAVVRDIEPLFCLSAPISITAAGTSDLVPGVPGKKIRVTAIAVAGDANCQITFLSGSTAETGAIPLAARTPLALTDIGGSFETAEGAALRITVASAGAINAGGLVGYRLVE